MKHIFTLLALVISLGAFSQKSNLIVFNNGGQQFFVVLNGIKQNAIPKTNVKIEGLAPTNYKVKIIFADGKTGDIDKTVYMEPNMEYSAQVVIKSAKKRSLRLFDMTELNASPYGTGAEAVTYRPNEGAVYTDQAGQTTTQTQVNNNNTNNNNNGQATGTVQTGTQTNGTNGQASGTVQTGNQTYGTTGTVQGGTYGTTGTVQTSATGVNGQTQVSTGVTTTGNAGTTQTGNVQVNMGMNGQTGTFNQTMIVDGDTVVVDMGMTGMGTPTRVPTGMQTTTTSNGTQTTTTTVNGQTTQVTTNVSGMNGQTQTSTTQTTINGQNGQVSTNVTGSGMGHPTGTHTHADGTVHDQNHQVITTTTANGQTTNVTTGTHTHADGTVHDQNHKPVTTDKKPLNRPTTGNGEAIVNSNGTLTCNSSMGNIDYVINGVKAESFSSDQMELVRKELKTKCINSDQAYRIVNAFTFDGDKIEMAKFCFDHMTDRNNASKLLDLFLYASSKDELKEYFGKL